MSGCLSQKGDEFWLVSYVTIDVKAMNASLAKTKHTRANHIRFSAILMKWIEE